jgi:hypothetical protein
LAGLLDSRYAGIASSSIGCDGAICVQGAMLVASAGHELSLWSRLE